MRDHLVGLEPSDGGVAPGRGATGEDQALRALLLGERVIGIRGEVDLACFQHRFAGAAIAGPAAVRVGHALRQCALKDRLTGLDGYRSAMLADGDRKPHERYSALNLAINDLATKLFM